MTDKSGNGNRRTRRAVGAGASFVGGVLLASAGLFSFLLGLSTLIYDALLRYGARWVFKFNEPWWGWIHVVLGIVMVVVGFAVMFGAKWAVIAALGLATGSTMLMVLWTVYYPMWTIPAIILGVAAIGALAIADPTLRRRR